MFRRLWDSWRTGRVRKAAARWVVRMHGPDAFRWRDRFERWRQADPRRAQIYDRQLAIWQAAPGLADSESEPVRPRTPIALYALAASVVAIAFGLAGASSWSWRKQSPVLIAAEPNEQRSLLLEDGSRVLLAGGSRLEVVLDQDSRRITLTRGRARLDVHRDRRMAIVRAGPALVRTAAATVDVRLDGAEARVILLAGHVQLARYDADASAGNLDLQPGQIVEIGKAAPPGAPRRATATELSWPQAMISFDDAPLAEVVERANGLSLTPIVLGDPSLGLLRVTGAYRMGDNKGLAQSLSASLGLTVTRGPNDAIRVSRPSR